MSEYYDAIGEVADNVIGRCLSTALSTGFIKQSDYPDLCSRELDRVLEFVRVSALELLEDREGFQLAYDHLSSYAESEEST